MPRYVMLQGTSSHVGKSILTTALCRIFLQDGKNVVPFKAQNMALNSYVTSSGEEIGRAQVVQAEAAGLEPIVEMNPVLLKPTGNACSQVILMGKPVGNMSAKEYHTGYSLKALSAVKQSLEKLKGIFDVIVIEGAGSPAEVNLKANDIVNMRIAKLTNAPVLLVADIDRGGALAAVVGTLELLEQDERDLVRGIIINKFRGDLNLLKPALDFLEEKTGKPVLGVIPYLEQLGIEDEDSVSLDDKRQVSKDAALTVAVIRTPKISNFTDFDSLANETDVNLKYIQLGETIGNPDLIILPGSKNTTEDLLYLRENGYEEEIKNLVNQGIPIIGICGGYQMLGKTILDPAHTESNREVIAGLNLLDIKTTFISEKLTSQVTANYIGTKFLDSEFTANDLHGYEIHMGRTEFITNKVQNAFVITNRSQQRVESLDGVISENGLVMGTYIHGIFDNDDFRRSILNALRCRKGLSPLNHTINTAAEKQANYNRLANTVRNHLNMELLYKIMES
ncbi:cobyric acid synthase [Anaerosinus massiliensis]|uniref:cobyric acid synthase n=1 Tax=Massilibacillus massiliensis TaxID=1806837 RepID=UPI000B0E46A5|nr:cobyric acid synthase [Massilibacillus massiliensis]